MKGMILIPSRELLEFNLHATPNRTEGRIGNSACGLLARLIIYIAMYWRIRWHSVANFARFTELWVILVLVIYCGGVSVNLLLVR